MLAGNLLLRNISTRVFGDNLTSALGRFNNIFSESRRYAGHSHWKNIKATKEARDGERQRLICGFVRKINVAVEMGGGQTNPKLNSLLARLLEEGKSKDIPLSTIDKAIQRLEKKKNSSGALFTVEARSITGASIIIESSCEKQKHFRQLAQSVMKRNGGVVVEMGTCAHLFERKGVAYVPAVPMNEAQNSSYTKLVFDKASDLAIEAGAEDVFEEVDEDNEILFKFVCEMRQFSSMKKFLENQELKVYESRLEYVPKTTLKLGGESLDLLLKTIDGLEALEDCEAVYHNVEPISNE